MPKYDDNHQKLVDIIFEVGQVTRGNKELKKMTQKEYCSWISKQLEMCGFPTQPMGASWGVLLFRDKEKK